jgi:hypothetical protein
MEPPHKKTMMSFVDDGFIDPSMGMGDRQVSICDRLWVGVSDNFILFSKPNKIVWSRQFWPL